MPTMRRRAGMVVALARYSPVVRAFSAGNPPPPVKVKGGQTKAIDWDADRYSKNAGFVPGLGKTVLDLLAPLNGECVLDVGCGDGVLTAELKARGCTVVGIDFSPNMVAAAVKRNIDAYVMDASAIDAPFVLSKIAKAKANTNKTRPGTVREEGAGRICWVCSPRLPRRGTFGLGGSGEGGDGIDHRPATAAFDAVFTNQTLHWIRTPRTVIDGAKRFGGHGNLAAIRVAMYVALSRRGIDPLEVDPWYFPTVREYRRELEAAGFIVDNIELVPGSAILPAGTGMKGVLSIFTQAFLSALPQDPSCGHTDENGLSSSEAAVIDEAVAILQPAVCDEDGIWTSGYVSLRFKAHLPLDGDAGNNRST
eukprot:jgi/Undpi1/110/HiC_scaffold_1.g00110.m1